MNIASKIHTKTSPKALHIIYSKKSRFQIHRGERVQIPGDIWHSLGSLLHKEYVAEKEKDLIPGTSRVIRAAEERVGESRREW